MGMLGPKQLVAEKAAASVNTSLVELKF